MVLSGNVGREQLMWSRLLVEGAQIFRWLMNLAVG